MFNSKTCIGIRYTKAMAKKLQADTGSRISIGSKYQEQILIKAVVKNTSVYFYN